MNIRDVLDQVDTLKPNQFDEAQKIYWLSQLDRRVYLDVIATHEKDEDTPGSFAGYAPDVDQDTELLVKEPFSDIYRWYLEAMIDLGNGEQGKYQNSMLLFNTAWADFARDYHRKHRPIGQRAMLFGAGGRTLPVRVEQGALDAMLEAATSATQAANAAAGAAETAANKATNAAWNAEAAIAQVKNDAQTATSAAASAADAANAAAESVQDVADTVQEKLDKLNAPYTLIETITLEEDVASVIRTKEPDGTPLGLSHLHLKIISPKYTENRTIYVSVGSTDSEYIMHDDRIAYLAYNTIINTYGYTTEVFADREHGLWQTQYIGPTDYTSVAIVYSSHAQTRTGTAKAIRIFPYYNNTNLIPAGTTIEIWGVRDDA